MARRVREKPFIPSASVHRAAGRRGGRARLLAWQDDRGWHPLSAEDIGIWDAWADAYQLIHHNLRAALEAVGVTEEGKAKSGQAASAVMSAFEGSKLRFFGHLLAGLKAPSLVASIREDLAAGRIHILIGTHADSGRPCGPRTTVTA